MFYVGGGLGAYGWFGLSIMAMHAAMMFVILGGAVIVLSWQSNVLPWSLSISTTAAFACGVIALVFIGFNISRAQVLMKETNRQIAHSEDIPNGIDNLLIEILDAQSHVRGYIITGDEQLKTRYLEAKTSSNVKLDALRKLVADRPQQQQQFARIEASVNAELQWLQQVIDVTGTGMSNDARNKMVVHGEDFFNNLL